MRFIAHTPDMRGPTPHPVFSLRTSAFNEFLYAPVGEEDNGMVLSALSALARLGVDPWEEAARLSELPKEAATKRLTSIIAGLPHGQWAQSAAADIAARLVALLPVKHALADCAPAAVSAKTPASAAMVALFFLILSSALVFSVLRDREPQPATGQTRSVSAPEAAPQVPLPGAE